MNLPSQDNTVGKALKTFAQAWIGFSIGLIVVIWGVPGVPQAALQYVHNNLAQLLLTMSIPTALTSFVWNLFRPSQKVY